MLGFQYFLLVKFDYTQIVDSWTFFFPLFQSNRKTWELELNISAPQIILVEHFCDKNAVIAVVDFGRFHLSTQDNNRVETQAPPPLITTTRDSDDEEGTIIFLAKSILHFPF